MHLVLENMAATETVYCAEKVGYLIVVTTVPVEQPEDHGRSSRHKVLGTISHKIPVWYVRNASFVLGLAPVVWTAKVKIEVATEATLAGAEEDRVIAQGVECARYVYSARVLCKYPPSDICVFRLVAIHLRCPAEELHPCPLLLQREHSLMSVAYLVVAVIRLEQLLAEALETVDQDAAVVELIRIGTAVVLM